MKNFRRIKRIRRINEQVDVASVLNGGGTGDMTKNTVTDDDQQTDTSQDEQKKQQNEVVAGGTKITVDMVKSMSDGQVLTNFITGNSDNMEDSARQEIQNRINQLGNNIQSGSITPDQKKDLNNSIIAGASNANLVGQSLDWMEKIFVKAIAGKRGERGRMGSFVWDGDDFYRGITQVEDGKDHYFNKWIAGIDRDAGVMQIQVTGDYWQSRIEKIAQQMGLKIKHVNYNRELVDLGYEDDDTFDPYDKPWYGDQD